MREPTKDVHGDYLLVRIQSAAALRKARCDCITNDGQKARVIVTVSDVVYGDNDGQNWSVRCAILVRENVRVDDYRSLVCTTCRV